MGTKVVSALWIFIILCSCAPSITKMPVCNGVAKVSCCGADCQQCIHIKYLGVGGFLIQRGEDVILTAPFFSNPSLLRVLFWRIHADPERINAFLPPVENVRAILVGHAHYDHLMDIPYIAQERAPHATIYGSQTMKNILAAVLPPERLVALDSEAAEPTKTPGKWQGVPGTKIRLMAIKSEHAPHVCLFRRHGCIKVFTGEVAAPLNRLPETAWGWKEGQTVAYLIDFLDNNGTVKFRIYYQDAASTPPWGFPPAFEPETQKAVDLAILCVPGFKYVEGYPQGIIQWIKPRFVILTHWEDFFRPRTGDPSDLRVVPDGTDPTIFIKQLEEALPTIKWLMPRPGAWLQFELEKLQAQPPLCKEQALTLSQAGENTKYG